MTTRGYCSFRCKRYLATIDCYQSLQSQALIERGGRTLLLSHLWQKVHLKSLDCFEALASPSFDWKNVTHTLRWWHLNQKVAKKLMVVDLSGEKIAAFDFDYYLMGCCERLARSLSGTCSEDLRSAIEADT